MEKRDERKEKLVMDEKKEKALDPYNDSDYMGDLPSELDSWAVGALDFDDLTKEGKNAARKMIARKHKKYEEWKKSQKKGEDK